MKPNRDPAAWLIDIEGVLVRDKRYAPVEGSVAWLRAIADSGRPWCLVSNNTTDTPQELVAKLAGAGFPVRPENLVGALGLASGWLLGRRRQRLMWLGHPRLADYWREKGFMLVEDGPCEAVVLGANPELSVARLDAALVALWEHGADLVCLGGASAFGTRRLGGGSGARGDLRPGGGDGQTGGAHIPRGPEKGWRRALPGPIYFG